jgi:glutaredoxin
MAKVTIYTTELCEPCTELKTWVAERGIDYVEITKKSLGVPELAALRRSIMTVSKADNPTLPAVCISEDGEDVWISNDGQCDIGPMTQRILEVLVCT